MPKADAGACLDIYEQLKEDEDFLLERLRLTIIEEILAAMETKAVDRAELARRLGTSRAYVTRVFNTSVNLTLRTLVKMSKVLGVKVSVHLHEPTVQAIWFELYERHEKSAVNKGLVSQNDYRQVRPAKSKGDIYEQSASAA